MLTASAAVDGWGWGWGCGAALRPWRGFRFGILVGVPECISETLQCHMYPCLFILFLVFMYLFIYALPYSRKGFKVGMLSFDVLF